MTKVVKRETEDKTVTYMIVGFCVGAIISLIFFEYYWVGVGAGAGMLLSILVSAYVDFAKAKEVEEEKPLKKAPTKKTPTKKAVKKAPVKKVSKATPKKK